MKEKILMLLASLTALTNCFGQDIVTELKSNGLDKPAIVEQVLERNWAVSATNNPQIVQLEHQIVVLAAKLDIESKRIRSKQELVYANPDSKAQHDYVAGNSKTGVSPFYEDSAMLSGLQEQITTCKKTIAYKKLLFLNASRPAVTKFVDSKLK